MHLVADLAHKLEGLRVRLLLELVLNKELIL